MFCSCVIFKASLTELSIKEEEEKNSIIVKIITIIVKNENLFKEKSI